MKVKVIRGSNQIGGSIIEVASESTRVILDVGSELGENAPQTPAVEGLFNGTPSFDAVLISHYHGDHLGLLDSVLPEIPVFMGKKAYAVYEKQLEYAGKPLRDDIRTFEPRESFAIGDIQITPYLCDHSAFDSYMYLLQEGDEKVLYTGDFRSNGRKNFKYLLSLLPEVDKLIVEGTTLSGKHASARTESDLEYEAVQLIKRIGDAPVFVNMASTNIDRIVTFFRTAKRTGRVLLEDTYTASLTAAISGNIPNPKFPEVKVFLARPTERDYDILQHFSSSKIGRRGISKERFVMMVRPSMLGYLEKLSAEMDFNGGLLIYSLWGGYKEDERTKAFLTRMEELGLSIVDLHVSGHADTQTIEALIAVVKPKEIIPVHTENAEWFERFKADE
ncbi:MBL fold metallo-hydrolase [Adlercreutzia caecimuris]|uniref:MBL fold metallo-hydrolase n=1 Tax=Adlercreutzia caecimuris TaxID=671266 RepID=UPI00272B46AF|nr:MBL fold metallo-hydrolase [Adlercreutzia caecimuris]